MATTYELIDSSVLTTTTASISFTSIPANWTDLVVRVSARANAGSSYTYCKITYNSTGSSYSDTLMYKDGTNATLQSQRASSQAFYSAAGTGLPFNDSSSVSNTFGSMEVYIPSYTASQNKPASVFAVQENNSSTQYMAVDASLWSNTAAITSLTLTPGSGSFVSGSSFYLYGISNA